MLQVKDEECRSKTIQHQIKYYQDVHQNIVKEKEEWKKVESLRLYEVSTGYEKNQKLKHQLDERLKETKEAVHAEKLEDTKKAKEDHLRNENCAKIKLGEVAEKQGRRRKVRGQEETKKMKVSRYLESRVPETIELKSLDTERVMGKATQREKELERLSNMEEEMAKRISKSVQVFQEMRNKLRRVVGNERVYLKLPSLSFSTQLTCSTNSTLN